MSFENPFQPEHDELSELRNRAVDLLRAEGGESSEARNALIAWRAAAEKKFSEASREETGGASDIRMGMEQAALFRDAGLYVQACEDLWEVQNQARQEGRRDLFDEAGDMIDAINKL